MFPQDDKRAYWQERINHYQQWDRTVYNALCKLAEGWQIADWQIQPTKNPFFSEGWFLLGRFYLYNEPYDFHLLLNLDIEMHAPGDHTYRFDVQTAPRNLSYKTTHATFPETAEGLQQAFDKILELGPRYFIE